MKDKKELTLHQLYNVRNTLDQLWVPHGPLAWSITNVVVFPSTTSVRKSHFLHFFHPDTPWEVSVNATPHTSTISILNFDGKGILLCAIDIQSKVTIWSMHGYIINDWQLIKITDTSDSSVYTIDSQPVICSSWTNIGQNYGRKTWNIKNDDVQSYWTAKFSKVGPSTLLKSKTLEVSIVNVTSRGLISLITPGKKAKTAYLPITNMQCADIIIPWKNYVDIGTVDIMCTLRLYTVEIEAATLKFSLSRIVELGPHIERTILDLKFDDPASSDSNFFILVQDQKDNVGYLEKWHLTQAQVPINPVIKGQTPEPMSKVFWEKKHSHKLTAIPNCMKVPVLPYATAAPVGSDFNKIGMTVAVGCDDGVVHILNRNDLSLYETQALPSSPDFKPKRGSRKMNYFTLSPVACCLAAVSDGIVSIFSFRNIDIETETEVVWLCSVLEHCILNGWNHWEIMTVAIRREDTLQRLEHTLNRSFDAQNPEIRQLYFSRMMSIKMTLYKLQTQTSHWPAQLWSCLFLNCLTDKFKSLLPVDVMNNFVTPPDADLNNIVNMVDMKQFVLTEQVLLTQQPLFQWVLDYSQLISICVLPQKRTSSTSNWQSVVTDSRTLTNLRDMLALIKIWSTLQPRCGPLLACSENTDYSGIFKSLSMLVKQFPCKSDIPNSDNDKIQLFQQKLTVIPTVHVSALVHASTTQEYEFQCEPNSLKCAKMLSERPVLPLSKANSVMNSADRDMLRNTILSAHSLHLKQDYIKQCVICGCVTTLNQPTTQQQWWIKWKHTCICGGNWKKSTVLA